MLVVTKQVEVGKDLLLPKTVLHYTAIAKAQSTQHQNNSSCLPLSGFSKASSSFFAGNPPA
jgi:hypothetical protein